MLATMGLSLSDAFRILLKRVAAEKALPFVPLIPNAETVEAMRAARRGDLATVGKPADLLASLQESAPFARTGADDCERLQLSAWRSSPISIGLPERPVEGTQFNVISFGKFQALL